jgi:hypothetical protein
MNTSSFLAALRANTSLPLVFRTGRQTVAPGYHLTEVKRVTYETMDCGAMAHHWAESQFEIWVPALAELGPGGRLMPAKKFLQIIDRVETELPLNGDAVARIHASFEGQPAALYDIEGVTARDGHVWVELSPDKTRCKAAERRLASGSSDCCGTAPAAAEKSSAPVGCGCGTTEPAPAAACCA